MDNSLKSGRVSRNLSLNQALI